MRHARLSVAVLAGLIGLAAALLPAVPSGAAVLPAAPQGGVVSPAALQSGALAAARPPQLPRGTVRLGAISSRTALHVDVTLRVRNPAALTAYIADLSDRKSPLFHHFLRPAQFGALFGPSLSQIAAVEAALRADGMTPGPVSADRLAIPVTAPAWLVERALHTGLDRYRLTGGRVAYANTAAPELPAAAAPYVQGILGLNDIDRVQSLAMFPARQSRPGTGARAADAAAEAAAGPDPAASGGPAACAAATDAAAADGSFTAPQLAAHYQMSPLYGHGDLGQGVNVALAEFEPDSASDIAAYEACYGLDTPVNYYTVDGGAGTGSGSGEAALDIEDLAGLAPDVTVDVYQAPNGGSSDVYDLYSQIINADRDQVVSTSWGLCELDSDSGLISSEDVLFAQAATQGQTVFAAAGDFGSTACYPDGSSHDADLSVSDPASQPYVVGVGGTSIAGTAETVWNGSSIGDGAGGGGLSDVWCMPAYQDQSAIPGLVSRYSKTSGSCPSAVPYLRQVPDVSADADPLTGYTIYFDGTWLAIGGTSGGAPLWAAAAALIDASPFCGDYGSGDAGVQPAGLYAIVAAEHSHIYGTTSAGLRDVTSGNNDYTPSGYTGGRYPATRGYDMASGLGTPLISGLTRSGKASTYDPGLAALMCFQYRTRLGTTAIGAISPREGPAGRSRTVTIHGIGFLPIAGADHVEIGSKQVTASCVSTTKCTVKLPALRPGTYTVRISVEDLTLSPVTLRTHYRVVAAPAVSSLSPASGRHKGGNDVTIRGTNFVGVLAVRFGAKSAVSFRVVSATEIVAIAPSGSGTVAVTVSAAGGTSAASTHSRYHY